MPATQIVDNTTTVTFTIAGIGKFNLPKPFRTKVEGDYVIIYDDEHEITFSILYSDVTAPVVASGTLLEAAIHAMFAAGAIPPLPPGAATAANQLLILAQLQSAKDFEGQYVKDLANSDVVVLQVMIYNEDTHTFDPPIYFNPDGTIYVPVNPPDYQYIDVSGILSSILAKLINAPATEAKQDAQITLLTTLAGKDYATQTTLAAVLAKLITNPATEAKQDTGNTSLASILAKLIVAPSTEAKQDAMITLLGTLAGKDYATQTTLASILAKLIVSPATEAKQDTMITSLAAIVAKLIVSPATEAKQDAGNLSLANIDASTKRGTTPAGTNVASSAANVTLKASNANRITLIIYNDSTSALYVKYGATATVTDFAFKVLAGQTLIIRDYTGIVDGIWDTANGFARVTEVTP